MILERQEIRIAYLREFSYQIVPYTPLEKADHILNRFPREINIGLFQNKVSGLSMLFYYDREDE